MAVPKRKPESMPAQDPPAAQLGFAAIKDPHLKPRDCQVLWALAHWAWGKKADCWPSNEKIAALIGCSERTVQFSITRLVVHGHLYRRMERTPTGWYRVLVIAERYRPELAIVEEPGGGGAIDCAPKGLRF